MDGWDGGNFPYPLDTTIGNQPTQLTNEDHSPKQSVPASPAERVAAPPEPMKDHLCNRHRSLIATLLGDCCLACESAALQAKVSTLEQALLELRTLIDKARRFTASDPDNQWCRQATIVLNYAITGSAQSGKSRQ